MGWISPSLPPSLPPSLSPSLSLSLSTNLSQLVDTSTGTVHPTPDAHTGTIWAIAVRPDGTGFMTGGADKLVKFWDITTSSSSSSSAAAGGSGSGSGSGSGGSGSSLTSSMASLSLSLTRQLQMTHDILCLRYNQATKAENLMIAVGLLDR